MSTWVNKEPVFGDHIRVNRGLYYHHGIYVTDDVIIQFGSTSQELNPELAKVMETNLDGFLKGGFLEVREYTEEEQKGKRTPTEIVNYAFMQIGRGGYNLLTNNCEHFANECVFGKNKSEQVDKIKDIFNIFK